MSTLTKIFVVLLVVFCIAFTMSTVAFVARTNEWRELAEAYQIRAQTADTHLHNVLASSAAQKALDRDAINAHIGQINDLARQNESAQRTAADLRAELAQARAEASSQQAMARLLGGELQVGQAGWTEQRNQREKLQHRNIDLEKRNLDLNERVNEQTAQLTVLQQELRRREQQIQLLREQATRVARGGGPGDADFEEYLVAGQKTVAAVTPATRSPIRGEVTAVSGSLATISVGSADGVAEGMVFVIYRGTDYIGDLLISKVDPNLAAGKIVRSSGTVAVGDSVADEARFGNAQ